MRTSRLFIINITMLCSVFLAELCYTHCNMVCIAYMKMHVHIVESCIFANNKCQVFAFLILYFCTWIIFRDTFVKFTNDVQN